MKIIYKKNFEQDLSPLILPFFEDGLALPEYLAKWHSERVKNQQFTNKTGEQLVYFSTASKTPAQTLLLCLGKKADLTAATIRNNFALAIKFLRQKPGQQLALFWSADLKEFALPLGEALALANYSLPLYKTGQEQQKAAEKMLQKIIIVSTEISNVDKYDLEEGLKIGLAVNQVRDLINGPSNLINADTFAEKAQAIAAKNKYKLRILDKKQLEKLKMGALLGVNRGSEIGAKMLVLEYLPLGKRQEPVALVGKGVTFDTGGVNLKPTTGIGDMKKDMSGAAAVLGVFMLLKDLEIKQNVVGFIPLTDNAIDAKSLNPSDIVTSYSGKTIEIGNTDAEGRLILCDAIAYALKNYKPSAIIDIATLTGACMVALGDQYAGMWGNNDQIKKRMKNAASECDELVWEMPIHDHHRNSMKGVLTDLTNLDSSGLAGACTAAAFLEDFVEKTDWIHLDIAGVAIPKKFKDYDFAQSGTGFGVRLLLKFLQNIK